MEDLEELRGTDRLTVVVSREKAAQFGPMLQCL